MKARYKYRFYPTSQQQQRLAQLFGCVRVVWNDALAFCKQTEKLPKAGVLSAMLTQSKKTEERQWLKDVSAVPLQQSLRQLDVAWKNFFDSRNGKRKGKQMGAPKFKKRSNKQSATFAGNAFKLSGETVTLAKIGDLKPVWSRELPAYPSSVTVIKDAANRYFVSFVVEIQPVQIAAQSRGRDGRGSLAHSSRPFRIGIDLGIKTFAVMSNRDKAFSPNYKQQDRKIRKLQRKLARQPKSSKRRHRTLLRIAKQHNQIADKRSDFLHKLSTKVIHENQAIILEDLNVSGMVKNRKLSRAISLQGWREFRELCSAKSEKFARDFHVINRWEPTSQICSDCGFKWGKLDLSVRSVLCLNCGIEQDRDENAARNIEKSHHRALGDSKRTQRAGKTGSPAQPGEASRITVASAR